MRKSDAGGAMSGFPEPPVWVPRPFPEVPASYMPRMGDLIQHITGEIIVQESDWVIPIGNYGRDRQVRVLACSALPKLRILTLKDEDGILEITGSGQDVPPNTPFISVKPDGRFTVYWAGSMTTILHDEGDGDFQIRLDRPFHIKRSGPRFRIERRKEQPVPDLIYFPWPSGIDGIIGVIGPRGDILAGNPYHEYSPDGGRRRHSMHVSGKQVVGAGIFRFLTWAELTFVRDESEVPPELLKEARQR